jgi:16S rRNA (cytosine967-C5)-methyltransferase
LGRTPWAPGSPALADAARAIASVVAEGRSSDVALAPFDTVPHRAAVRAIALGTLRWYLRLAPAVDILLPRPKGVAPEIHALLVASAHQVEYSRNPPEATVHTAVDAARFFMDERATGAQRRESGEAPRARRGATGLVNAVLRRFVRERAALLGRVDEKPSGRTAHPSWLINRLQDAWPEQVRAKLLEANNEHPPMVLRLDVSRRKREDYLQELHSVGIAAQAISWMSTAIRLEQPISLSNLPGFQDGLVSVQDAGAQLAAPLLDARPGMRVLDACAAPGGKTGHLLEHTQGLAEVVAVDIDALRVARVEDNLRRLGRAAKLVVADVRQTASFSDGRPFERILLDAPCSSTGVIRRHPDIKLLRRADDIRSLAAVQLEILRATFGLLSGGGRLLYCTCSVLPQENQGVVESFLDTERTARAVPLKIELVPGALSAGPGLQLLPGAEAGTDGFYYACVEKTTAGT